MVLVFGASGAGVEHELYSFGFERLLQFGANFGIFARNNLFAGMKNGDAPAVAAKHLSKFQTDVPTSENEEVLGNFCKLQDGFVGEIRDGIHARDPTNLRPPANVDALLSPFPHIISNLH